MTIGIVKGVCISEKRGVRKKNVDKVKLIKNFGIENDAHAGDWHRQVSLLSYDKVEEFKAKGAEVDLGDFGENIIVSGIDFGTLEVGTILKCNDVVLEITQIGKHCHTHCEIYHRMGDCIMPREGIFAKVICEGEISVDDKMEVLDSDSGRVKESLKAAILTISDSGHKGEREDLSGKVIKELLEKEGYEIAEMLIIPDEAEKIKEELINFADRRRIPLIITTGGTGLSKRDVTPEATLGIAEKIVSGISEAMRANSMTITKRAMLSRGVSVVRKNSLIINLPGSPKAVKENLEFILPELKHGLEILLGEAFNCGENN